MTAKCEPCLDDKCHECDAYADLDQMTTEALDDYDEGWCCCTLESVEDFMRGMAKAAPSAASRSVVSPNPAPPETATNGDT
jgi:hypothetical protein